MKKIPCASLRSLFSGRGLNSAETAHRLVTQYGPWVRLGRFGRHVLLADADAVQHVFLTHQTNYTKDTDFYYTLMTLFGRGLLTSEGARWQAKRQWLQPLFTPQHIKNYVAQSVEVIDQVCTRFTRYAATGEVFSMDHEMLMLSVMMTLRLFFHEHASQTLAESIIAQFNVQHFSAVNARLPGMKSKAEQQKALVNANTIIDTIATQLLHDHRDDVDDNLITRLYAYRDEQSGEAYSHIDLIDEVKTFLGTGHDTVGTSLGWAWHLLLTHPACEDKLRAETDVVLRGRLPEFMDFDDLPYTQMVFNETIRLYPPIWMMPRKAKTADVVHGYSVPAQTVLLASPYVLHRLPCYWNAPESFNPERFSKTHGDVIHKHAFIPFGAGPRVCIARMLADYQARLALAMMAQRFRFTLQETSRVVRTNSLITLKPYQPIYVTCQQRGKQ